MITEPDLEQFSFKPEKTEEFRKAGNIFTGFPAPILRYRLVVESYAMSIEEPYFWVLEYIRNYAGYPYIIKINDVFTASENSSFFGASQQRLGMQQERVSQYLTAIGKMVR